MHEQLTAPTPEVEHSITRAPCVHWDIGDTEVPRPGAPSGKRWAPCVRNVVSRRPPAASAAEPPACAQG